MTSTEHIRMHHAYEHLFRPRVESALNHITGSISGHLRNNGVDATIHWLKFSGVRFPKGIITDINITAGTRAAQVEDRLMWEQVRKAQKRFTQPQWVQFINNYLKVFLLEKSTVGIEDTIKALLLKFLNQSVQNGWGLDETVRRLEGLGFEGYQAARIVRTEVNRALNLGSFIQGVTFPFELQKTWVAIRDNRTRGTKPHDHADHWSMGGQTVDFFEPFTDFRSGAKLMFPGDPDAAAADVVNCRCVMVKKAKRDENSRLIRRAVVPLAA